MRKSTHKFKYLKTERFFENYDELNESFPKDDDMETRLPKINNNRYDINLKYLEERAIGLSSEWIKEVEKFKNIRYFHKLCDELRIDRRALRTMGRRGQPSDDDVLYDVQFAYNTKNKTNIKTWLRCPHVDASNKIIVILVYFPYKDQSYTFKDHGELLIFDEQNAKTIDKIRYNHNNGIIFMNSKIAWHAPISLLNHEDEHRRFLNVIYMRNNKS